MAKRKVPNRQKTPPRKPKEPFKLSQRAKQGIIAGAALVVLIILFLVIRENVVTLNLDADGKVVNNTGANWLIYNTKTTSNPRYLKMGEIEPAEGYVLDKVDFLSDPNEPIYYFKPESGDENALTYAVMLGKSPYQEIAATTVGSVSALLAEPTMGEVVETRMGDKNVAYYIYSGAAMNQEDAEKIDYYNKQMNAYAEARDGRSVVFMIDRHSDSPDGYAADEDYVALMEKAILGLKL